MPRDAPAVDRIKRHLHFEMKAAMRIFQHAHKANKEIPDLVSSERIRTVVSPSLAKKAKANGTNVVTSTEPQESAAIPAGE